MNNLSKKNIIKILKNINTGLYIVDSNRKIIFWNKIAEKISGFKADEVTDKFCYEDLLQHIDEQGNSLCYTNCPMAKSLDDNLPRESNIYLHHKKGHRIPIRVNISTCQLENNETVGIEVFTDISHQTHLKKKYKKLKKLVHFDNLTELPNRKFLEVSFERILHKNNNYGILFFDIDNFKKFNDTYGHNAGDIALRTISKSLLANQRVGDIVGRWGGEEFIALIANINKEELLQIANRFRIMIENSIIHLNDIRVNITASIGASIITKQDTMSSAIIRADTAMYESKQSGKNKVTYI